MVKVALFVGTSTILVGLATVTNANERSNTIGPISKEMIACTRIAAKA